MSIANRDFFGPRFGLFAVAALGLIVAVLLGSMIASNALVTVIVIGTLSLILAWLVLARQRWWVIVPAAGTLGGYFWFGFKVYPHEVAIAACLAPLVMTLAIRSGRKIEGRPKFPVVLFLLAAYLAFHWIGSNIYNKIDGGGGYGNVTRAYFNAYWVILFLVAFWKYGNTTYLAAALFLSYIAAAFRVIVGLITYLTNAFAYIPVINYVLPGSTHSRGGDLRASGLTLATLAACYFLIQRGFFRKGFHLAVFAASSLALLFGAGRTVLVLACLIPLFAALIYRQVAPLLLATLAVGTVVLVLNVNPSLLDHVPFAVQRSTSILLVEKEQSVKYGLAESSDEWHANLRALGFKKWTESWHNFLFGTGIRPYDNAISDTIGGVTTNEDYLESSAKVGAYESGWWTVIAVTGLTGLILYVTVFFYLLRRLVPVLLEDKVHDHAHAFAFMGVFGIIIWIGLGWTTGAFPSTEIMFGFLALAAIADAKAKEPVVVTPEPERVRKLPQRPVLAGR